MGGPYRPSSQPATMVSQCPYTRRSAFALALPAGHKAKLEIIQSLGQAATPHSFQPAGMVVVGDLLASHYSCVAVIPRRPKRVVEPGWTLTPLSCPPPAVLQVEVALSKAYTCRNISWANFSYIFQFSVPFYQNGLPSVVPGRFTHPFTLTRGPQAQHTYLQGSGAYNSNCPSVLSH